MTTRSWPFRLLSPTVFLVGSFMLACAGQDYSITGYTAEVGSWVGQDANTLVRVWGPPASTFTMPNGDSVYVYVNATDIATDKHIECSYNSKTQKEECSSSGGETIHLGCTTSFEVGPDQRVSFTRAEGTLCVAAKQPLSPSVATPLPSPPVAASLAASPPVEPGPDAAPEVAATPGETPEVDQTPAERRRARRNKVHQ